tara:strand:- start:1342 stop:1461 length:120 start_codon:yes stop_codon:yes gene_type:complete
LLNKIAALIQRYDLTFSYKTEEKLGGGEIINLNFNQEKF